MRAALVAFAAVVSPGCALMGLFTSTRSEFVAPEPEALRRRLALETPRSPGDVEHFAVLIGGDTSIEHRGNISLAYQVLLEQGYRRDRVYILDSEGDNPFFPVTDVTTRASVALLFDHLAAAVGSEDTVLVYVTGRGLLRDPPEGQADAPAGAPLPPERAALALNPGEELDQAELAAMLGRLEPRAGIAFFDQCYWAKLESPSLCNFVFIDSSEGEGKEHGGTFARAFWSAFRERRPPVGPLSIFDAFRFGMVADRATALGRNKPRIAHECVSPASLTLLGLVRTSTAARAR